MNTRKIYLTLRRAYRTAHNGSMLDDGRIEMCVQTTSAMRAFTGQWETCDPVWKHYAGIKGCQCHPVRRQDGSIAFWAPIVTNSCRRWMRAHASKSLPKDE